MPRKIRIIPYFGCRLILLGLYILRQPSSSSFSSVPASIFGSGSPLSCGFIQSKIFVIILIRSLAPSHSSRSILHHSWFTVIHHQSCCVYPTAGDWSYLPPNFYCFPVSRFLFTLFCFILINVSFACCIFKKSVLLLIEMMLGFILIALFLPFIIIQYLHSLTRLE